MPALRLGSCAPYQLSRDHAAYAKVGILYGCFGSPTLVKLESHKKTYLSIAREFRECSSCWIFVVPRPELMGHRLVVAGYRDRRLPGSFWITRVTTLPRIIRDGEQGRAQLT